MGKFTPGPWSIDSDTKNTGYAVGAEKPKRAGGTKSIVTVRPAYWSPEALDEARANARLIAAAPDLLEALLLFVEGFDPDHEYTDPAGVAFEDKARHALAAISKATT